MADEFGSSLRHRRMRAPVHHGETLFLPPATDIESLWRQNLRVDFSNCRFNGENLEQLRRRARAEAIDAALAYSQPHRDVAFALPEEQRIVMAGHQPTLFHPGVWYKNFVLSELAGRWGAVAINLVVDNDICGPTSIRLPVIRDDSVVTELIHFDRGGAIVPFEDRRILDMELFRSFGTRVAEAIRPIVKHPLINMLWPRIVDQAHCDRVGLAIARGRHALEAELGLRTLELPISRIAATSSFAVFVAGILGRLAEFIPVHNQVLNEYRSIHKIRSRFQPVPELRIDGGWMETPFWIWQADSPQRRSMFVERAPGKFRLSNRLEINIDLDANDFPARFAEIQQTKIRIRPKALMTTLFSRLVLSDMFIHGIGGAKYDQLTDELARRFLGIELPQFLTVTATMNLAPDFPGVSVQQVSAAKSLLRELEFQPERFLRDAPASASEIVNRKRHWIDSQLPPGNRRERHEAIVNCNRLLQPFVEETRTQTAMQLARLEHQLGPSRIMCSREYSFCLHGKSPEFRVQR